MKEKVLTLRMPEGFFLSQKLCYQVLCIAPSLLPRKKKKKGGVDFHNLFLGVAMDLVSPFWLLEDHYFIASL